MGEFRPRDPTPAVFVGRLAQLNLLIAGLDRAFEGKGGVFLLSGEPGIGKTRLAEALTVEARRRGAAVFAGRSTQAEGAPPYWPWVQILRSLIRDVGEQEFGRLAGPALVQILQVVPELRGHFPDAAPAAAADEQARFRIYDSLTQVLLDAAAKRPIVLVLDDMHWADAPTLLVLKLLAGALAQASVMVIVTYRDRELAADSALRAQVADFVRAGETTEIAIVGLNQADVAHLFRGLTGFDLDAGMVHRLVSQTAGNPFFISELAKAFATEDQDSPRWKYSDLEGSVPSGVDAVLRRSVEGLSDDCRRMLEVAAVAGQELHLDLLEAATGTVRVRILGLVDEAITKGVATRVDGGYSFAHGLVRDTVYRSLPTARRSELHARIGRVLEELTIGWIDPPVAQLSYHFVEASVLDKSLRRKALDYASAAARRALSELAYEEAVRILELTLAKIAPEDVADRAKLLLELGRARYMSGDIGGAMARAAEVSHLADKSNDSDLLARAALVVRGVGGPGLSAEIKRLCTVAMGRPTADTSLRIQVLSQLTVALMQTGDAADERAAEDSSREAVRLAEDAVDPDVVFAGIHARQMATSGPDGVDERLQLADRTLRLAQEAGRPSIAQWGHAWRIDALIQLGQIDQAEIAVAVQARHADELREPLARWRSFQLRSWLALLHGRFDEAGELADAARELGRKGHHAPAEFTHVTHLLGKAIYIGGIEAAYEAMGRFMGSLGGLGTEAAAFAAGPLALMGRLEDARSALRLVAAAGLDTIGPPMAWLPAMALLTEAIAAVDERDLATGVYARLVPYARLNVSAGGAGLYGSVSRHLGMLAATLERWDESAEHYERSLEFERRMNAPPHLVRSQIAYAEMLLRRRRETDLRRARQHIDAAIASCRELGMKPWLERATRIAADLQAKGMSDHPLTGRELEVAALVAEGLSNRAIANRLHLSERTAESHVKNVCDKLGFNSRSQVAAWMAGRRATR